MPRANDDCRDLIEGLLEINFRDRKSASESLQMSWFDQSVAVPVATPRPPPSIPPSNSTTANPGRPHRRPSQDAYDNECLTKRTRPN